MRVAELIKIHGMSTAPIARDWTQQKTFRTKISFSFFFRVILKLTNLPNNENSSESICFNCRPMLIIWYYDFIINYCTWLMLPVYFFPPHNRTLDCCYRKIWLPAEIWLCSENLKINISSSWINNSILSDFQSFESAGVQLKHKWIIF